MKPRLGLLLALAAVLCSSSIGSRSAVAQSAETDDGVRMLLDRLQRVIQAGDQAAFEGFLVDSADRKLAANFAASEIVPGATRVVLREREREPLAGTLPGNGYRLSIDAFAEFGDRARSANWSLDVKRSGQDDPWRLADERRVAFVENLYRLSLSSTRQFDARGLSLSVDDFDLMLTEGSAFPVEIDQGTTGLVLMGRGEIRFHPAPEVEKGQLKIFCGAEALQARFDTAFIRVNPTDVARLIEPERLVPKPVDPREARRAEEVFHEEVVKSYGVDLSDLSRDLWSLVPNAGDFLAEVRTQRFDTLTFTKSGSEAEDLSLFDRRRHKNISVYASRQSLERHGRSYNEDDFASYDVLNYDIDVAMFPERLWLEGRAKLQLRVSASAVSSLTLRLADPLFVQSIVSDRFGRLFGIRVKNQNSIVVNLPSTILRDDELQLTIAYAGRLAPQNEDAEAGGQLGPPQNPRQAQQQDEAPVVLREPSFLYSNRSYWYPQGTVTDYATARVRVTLPNGYSCVASGAPSEGDPSLVEVKDAGTARKVYEFAATKPVRYLAFLVSRFVATETVAVPLESGGSLSLRVQANPRQVRRGRELVARARDIAQFYDSLLDDSPYSSFTIGLVEGEVPGGHSPGYFAAVNEPFATTLLAWRNDPASFDGYPEFVIAHELAHQWWGQAVGWRNYHEQWVSEGFAQYFAALYAQHHRGDELFANMLRQFRRWGMQQSDQGPIYLGYRLGHLRNDSRVFRALVYNKSAAVLHMLRRLVGDEAFFSGVRQFYESSRFRKVGTDDFRTVMETETGRPLDRFFEQWIYGSSLPRLKFSYRVEPAASGQQVVLHVEQMGEVFDVPLTVRLIYGDKKEAQVIVPVTERIVDFPVPLTGTLRAAEVNKDDGTLAEIVKN